MGEKTNTAQTLQFLVATLPGHPDIGLLRAAARRGATAILNLEAVENVEAVVSALLRSHTGRIGVRVVSCDTLAGLPASLVDSIDVLVCTRAAASVSPDFLVHFRSARHSILVECTTVEDARTAAELNVDGLIAKGHEAGGCVGEETTFVLVQRFLAQSRLPVWAHGGISTHTASACLAAGCAGVVLDAQLMLARESDAPEFVKAMVARMSGDETVCVGSELGERYRVFRRPDGDAVQELQRLAAELSLVPGADTTSRWREAIRNRVEWSTSRTALWPFGQDAAFAADLAKRFRTVAGILRGLEQSVAADLQVVRELCPLDRDAPLAKVHGTEFPILQGPMTRVSDTAGFAAAVAEGGGLPFLALSLLRAPQLRSLLRETKERLGERPWGVGILGFVPLELREEQLAVIEEFRPPFALIAGGRPDQAVRLERLGIPTYLHVPAPAVLKMFLEAGARHFIFEGRECGGHVGPRTSFVLWQLAVEALLEAVVRGVAADDLHVVFAGGIHDARSAAMVSAIAAPLAKAGARIGVLIGTAYLFTEEAVSSGAIVDTFQAEAVRCAETVLLESGPGHATRCVATPFADTFRDLRRQLVSEGKSAEDIRLTLETLNLGRLRVASKAIKRNTTTTAADDGDAVTADYLTVDVDEQRRDGMYMIGQVAALRDQICRIADLHQDISVGSTALLRNLVVPENESLAAEASAVAANVAIIGMGCLLPRAQDVGTLWRNVLNGVDAIREVPRERFDVDKYFDPDRHARDGIYSKWGGFLDEVPFDPLKHGIPPSAVPSIDPFQLLTLEVVDQALQDAGYADRPFNRERTSVILGASGGGGELGFRYGIRAGLPMFLDHVSDAIYERLPEWTEDSFAGVLLNVAAGRVANRLDLGGLNFTVDAACASSLAAVFLAARELETGSSDMVLVGGIDTVNSPFGYLCFSSAQALSPRGRCSTFDESADGIAISEGLAVLVVKRLEDAERDGDRVYAVIKAVAGSSDGRGKGLTAPRPEGQMRVLNRAYAAAGVSPATVGLVEAHGTGTVAGDGAEVTALSRVFAAAGATPQGCALGSIKSMIGHTKAAAGVTGLLKVALSLHHKVLPPTLNVTKPNAKLREADTPFYVNTEAQPWIAPGDVPRRGGVSSFGFGGTNFHVVVEEYDSQSPGAVPCSAPTDEWPAELAVWSAASVPDLIAALDAVEQVVASAPHVPLRTVAAAICRSTSQRPRAGELRLAMVVESIAELRKNIASARAELAAGRTSFAGEGNVYGGVVPDTAPQLAFLFPGQGSQYPGMHRELALHFPDLRHALEIADRVIGGLLPRRLSSYVYPPPAFTRAETDLLMQELTDTAVAQPALGAVEAGLLSLFDRLAVRPSWTAGHSYGEDVALLAAGVFSTESLFALSAARGRLMRDVCGGRGQAMAAATVSADRLTQILPPDLEVWVANLNTPRQTVLAGSGDGIDKAIALLAGAGVAARRIDVSCAFHSPLVDAARHEMAAVLSGTAISAPRIPVFSNSVAHPYPDDPAEIRQLLANHIVRPVRFVDQIENMYAAGARVFLELGPRSVLTNLVREILAGRDALVIPVSARDKPEIPQLLTTLAQLAVLGTAVDFGVLWHGRSVPVLRVSELVSASPPVPPAHAWMVSGGQARGPAKTARPSSASARAAAASPSAPPAGQRTPIPPHPVPREPASVQAQSQSAVVPLAVPRENGRQTGASNGRTMHTPRLSQQPLGAADHDSVMHQFQQLMSQFLQTQALVMTTYLQGESNTNGHHVSPPLQNGLPGEATAALEATARVASPHAAAAVAAGLHPAQPPSTVVVPAAVVGTSAGGNGTHTAGETSHAVATAVAGVAASANVTVSTTPVPRPITVPAPAPVLLMTSNVGDGNGAAGAPHLTEAQVLTQLVRIVSDRTGYPDEMLAPDANIEADLGIDSIKRMEILAAFQEMHGSAAIDSFQQALERLTAMKTLRESAATIVEIFAAPAAAATV